MITDSVDSYVKSGWVTYTGSSTKSVTNNNAIDPATGKTGYKLSGTFYQVKQQTSKNLTFYVTGITKLTIYANATSSGRQINVDVNGKTFSSVMDFKQSGAQSYDVTLSPSTLNTINVWATNDVPVYAIKATVASSTEPALSVNPSSLDLEVIPTTTDLKTSETFTVIGQNLTAGTYNLTIPAIDGLSVNPTSFTVGTDGSVNQDFTVSYAPTTNVEADTDSIIVTAGDLKETVKLNYSAKIKATEQRVISDITTWDFSKTGIAGGENKDKVPTATLYADLGAKTSADFAADAITIVSNTTSAYPLEGNTNCRVGKENALAFKTSVPGTVVVTFCSSNAKKTRTLSINGEATSFQTSSNQIDGTVDVPAGDVTVSGTDYLKIFKIVFTPLAPAASVTIKANFQRTSFSSDKAIDFSKTEGLTAYVVTDATGKVAAVTSVPANTGVIVERAAATAEAQTFTLYEATDAAAPAANLLSAASALTTTDGASIYGYGRKNGVEGFYLYKSGLTPTAGKAYLVLPQTANAKEFISFGGNNGQTDAINAVIAEQNAENANIYNLAGQQVNKAYKGVVVINGKKYIQK